MARGPTDLATTAPAEKSLFGYSAWFSCRVGARRVGGSTLTLRSAEGDLRGATVEPGELRLDRRKCQNQGVETTRLEP